MNSCSAVSIVPSKMIPEPTIGAANASPSRETVIAKRVSNMSFLDLMATNRVNYHVGPSMFSRKNNKLKLVRPNNRTVRVRLIENQYETAGAADRNMQYATALGMWLRIVGPNEW